jgi:hypothetical protein
MVLSLPDGMSAQTVHDDCVAKRDDDALAYSKVTMYLRKTRFDIPKISPNSM